MLYSIKYNKYLKEGRFNDVNEVMKGSLSLESDIRNNLNKLLKEVKKELKKDSNLNNLKFIEFILNHPYDCKYLSENSYKVVREFVNDKM